MSQNFAQLYSQVYKSIRCVFDYAASVVPGFSHSFNITSVLWIMPLTPSSVFILPVFSHLVVPPQLPIALLSFYLNTYSTSPQSSSFFSGSFIPWCHGDSIEDVRL